MIIIGETRHHRRARPMTIKKVQILRTIPSRLAQLRRPVALHAASSALGCGARCGRVRHGVEKTSTKPFFWGAEGAETSTTGSCRRCGRRCRDPCCKAHVLVFRVPNGFRQAGLTAPPPSPPASSEIPPSFPFQSSVPGHVDDGYSGFVPIAHAGTCGANAKGLSSFGRLHERAVPRVHWRQEHR